LRPEGHFATGRENKIDRLIHINKGKAAYPRNHLVPPETLLPALTGSNRWYIITENLGGCHETQRYQNPSNHDRVRLASLFPGAHRGVFSRLD
jgi:hypothetical protein